MHKTQTLRKIKRQQFKKHFSSLTNFLVTRAFPDQAYDQRQHHNYRQHVIESLLRKSSTQKSYDRNRTSARPTNQYDIVPKETHTEQNYRIALQNAHAQHWNP